MISEKYINSYLQWHVKMMQDGSCYDAILIPTARISKNRWRLQAEKKEAIFLPPNMNMAGGVTKGELKVS